MGVAALRARLGTVFLGVALLVGLVFFVQPLWWYASGASTTATVEGCGPPNGGGRKTVCWGDWTLPSGVKGHGRVAGTGKDDVGKTVEVRASKSHAAAFTLRLVYGPLLVLLVGALFGYTSYRQRADARAGARPAETGPVQDRSP